MFTCFLRSSAPFRKRMQSYGRITKQPNLCSGFNLFYHSSRSLATTSGLIPESECKITPFFRNHQIFHLKFMLYNINLTFIYTKRFLIQFVEHLHVHFGIVGSEEVHSVVNTPFHLFGRCNFPSLDGYTSIVATPDKVGIVH